MFSLALCITLVMYFDGDDVTDWDNEVVEIQMDTINTLLGSAVYSLQNATACFCKTHTFKKMDCTMVA